MARKRSNSNNNTQSETTKAFSKAIPLPLPKTENQKKFLNSLKTNEMSVVIGSAGTGKTYLAIVFAAHLFSRGLIEKIILTKPTTPTGRSIGFFPGELLEKMLPWASPMLTILEEVFTKEKVELMLKRGQVQLVPFEVIRGSTFNNSFVILDEAQNSTSTEIKAFLTRHGENCKTVINGDITQSDLPKHEDSGLNFVCRILLKNKELNEVVPIIEFTSDDIIRSSLCKQWVKAFEQL